MCNIYWLYAYDNYNYYCKNRDRKNAKLKIYYSNQFMKFINQTLKCG